MKKSSYEYNKNNVPYAQSLRRNMTEAEKKLWYGFLSLLPITVHRQKNIGNYIVDFYIPKGQIAIELDGSQHSEPENAKKDMERDRYLAEREIMVMRYTNIEVSARWKIVIQNVLGALNMDNDETYAYIEKRRMEKIEERKNRFYKGNKGEADL